MHPQRRLAWPLFLAVLALGVSAFVTQVTLLRELLGAFSGNELVLGIVLGSWFLLTGLGTTLGRGAEKLQNPIARLVGAQIGVALLPLLSVFLLRALRNVVFVRGAIVGVPETVASCLVLLGPYCLLVGYLLTLSCLLVTSERGPEAIGRVYFLDNLGDVVGGAAFSFVLIYWLDHFAILGLVALLNLAAAALVAIFYRRRGLAILSAAAAALVMALMLVGHLDQLSTELEYAPQQVAFRGKSPYARLVVTQSAGQFTFFENGVNLFSSQNVEQVEETVHYALSQRTGIRRVLLISGGISGTAREILKYPQAEVDYVELDPLILDVARQLLPQALADPRIHVLRSDGRRFVKATDRRYDAVLIDVAEPSTSQTNRFYTREFLAELRRVLRPGGVVSFSLGEYGDYIGPELGRLVAVAQRTAADVFAHTLLIPGYRIYLLASDGPLSTDVAARLEARGVATRFVNRHYLRAALAADRLATLARLIDPGAPINRDFNPILYFYHLRYWMNQFQVRFELFEGALLVLLLVYLTRIRTVTLVLFTTGFAASTLEVVLLLGFQILYGCVYHQVGIIVTMFMLGLGIGSWTMNRWLPKCNGKDLVWPVLGLALLAAVLPPLLGGLDQLGTLPGGGWTGPAIVALLALLLAVLVGLIFPLAGKADFQGVTTTAARLYTADYLGSAIGALLVSTLLIPWIGVAAVCWLSAGLSVLSAAVVWVTYRV